MPAESERPGQSDDCGCAEDLIDRMIALTLSAVGDVSPDERQRIAEIGRVLRHEFGGEAVYIARRRPAELQKQVLAFADGRSVSEIARAAGVSRATVYRILRRR